MSQKKKKKRGNSEDLENGGLDFSFFSLQL